MKYVTATCLALGLTGLVNPSFGQNTQNPGQTPQPQQQGSQQPQQQTSQEPEKLQRNGELVEVIDQSLKYRSSSEEEPELVTISPKAKITLNGEKATLLDLKRGDKLSLSTIPGAEDLVVEVQAARTEPENPPSDEAPPAKPQQNSPALGLIMTDAPGQGILVVDVQDASPIQRSGVRAADFITMIDDQPIATPEELLKVTGQYAPGDSVEVVVWRKGETIKQDVTLAAYPVEDRVSQDPSVPLVVAYKNQGAPNQNQPPMARPLTVTEETHARPRNWGLEAEQDRDGMRVTQVHPNTPAATAGVLPGDYIAGIGGTPVDTWGGYQDALLASALLDNVPFNLLRNGETIDASLDFSDQTPVEEWGLQIEPTDDGRLRVTAVLPNSFAEAAGLERGDIIRSINGGQTESLAALNEALAGANDLDTIGFDLLRGRQVVDTSLNFDALARQRALGFQVTQTGDGLVISRVQPGSPAAAAGLMTGDQISGFLGSELNTLDAFNQALTGASSLANLGFDLLRNGQPVTANLDVNAGNPLANWGLQVTLDDQGLRITKVQPDSAAAAAGLQPGDFINGIGGAVVDTVESLVQALQNAPDFSSIGFEVTRNGQDYTATLNYSSQNPLASWGLQVTSDGQGGLRVTSVQPGSTAAAAGLQPGDFISGVGGTAVNTIDALMQALQGATDPSAVGLDVTRDGQTYNAQVDFSAQAATTQPGMTQPGMTQQGTTQPGQNPGTQPLPTAQTQPGQNPAATNPNATRPGQNPAAVNPNATLPRRAPGATRPSNPNAQQTNPTQPRQMKPAQPRQMNPAQPSPVQPGPAQPGPAQPSPAQPGPAQPGPAQPGPARPAPAPMQTAPAPTATP